MIHKKKKETENIKENEEEKLDKKVKRGKEIDEERKKL